MKKLDREMPFGEIHPPYEGAFYTQNGDFFDNEGNFLFGPKKTEAAPAAPVFAPEANKETTPKPAFGKGYISVNGDPVSLKAYAAGEVPVPFFAMKRAMKLAGFAEDDVASANAMKAAIDKRLADEAEAANHPAEGVN